MANILEFLRGVMTERDAQDAFHSDPGGYIEKAGFVDLSGEDVVEAILVLRRSLPEDLAARLAVFEDDDELPSVRPGPEEAELDAAVRMLRFAIAQSRGVVEAGLDDVAANVTVETEGDDTARDEPIEVENELDTDLAAEAPEPAPAPFVTPHVAREPTADAAAAVDRLSEVFEAIVRDAKTSLTGIVDAAATALADAAAAARGALEQAVAAADADVLRLRADGEAEREAARRDAERIRTEADNELQRAREQAEESRRRAEDLVAAAQAESEETRTELAARRAEMRELERQLKDRLSGIDSLFRTALGDEGGGAPPA